MMALAQLLDKVKSKINKANRANLSASPVHQNELATGNVEENAKKAEKLEKAKKEKKVSTKDAMKSLMQHERVNAPHFHHELPYRYFDRDKKVFINEYKGGIKEKIVQNGKQYGYGFAREVSPLIGSGTSTVESLNEMICKKLPTGKKWSYQFVLTGDRKVSQSLEINRDIHAQSGGMYERLANNQFDMAQKALVDGFPSGLGKGARFDLKNYRAFFFAHTTENDLNKLLDVKDETENDLSSSGIGFRDFEADDLIDFVRNMVNHNPLDSNVNQVNYNPYEDLNAQVYDASTEVNRIKKEYIDFQFYDDTVAYPKDQPINSRVVCLTLKKLPSRIFQWELQKYLSSFRRMGSSLACPFAWSVNFQIENLANSETQVNDKITSIQRAKESGLGRFMPFLEDELKGYREVQRGLGDDRYRICNFSVDLILYTDKANWRKDVSKAMNLYRDGLELINPKGLQAQTFLSVLPFQYTRFSSNRKKAGTRHRAKSSNLVNMLPLLGDYKGAMNKEAQHRYKGLQYGILTPSRTNQLAYFHPFFMGTDSYNMIVAGSQGSGKSVLVQSLILSLLSTGGLVVALDKGGSYNKMARAVGGQVINAGNLYLNPFAHLDLNAMQNDPELVNDPEISVQAIFDNSIAMIVELYAMIGRPNESVSDYEKKFLSNAINRAYRKQGTKTLVDDVVNEIKAIIQEESDNGQPIDRRKSDWVDYLDKYTTTGSSPDVFNRPTMFRDDASFICIEIEGVPEDLKNPLMMALSIDIENRFILSPSARQKALVIEEVGALLKHLKSEALKNKFEDGAATFRKKNATFINITQEVSEFFESSLLEVIYRKSALHIVMKQGEGFSKFAKDNELFDEWAINQIKSIRSASENRFSTFLLRIGQAQQSVHYFFLDPYSKVLTSTKSAEMEAVLNYRKQGFSVAESVEKVMWEYHTAEAQALADFKAARSHRLQHADSLIDEEIHDVA